jgi:hypothetical protein
MIENTSFAVLGNHLFLNDNYESQIAPHSHSIVPGGLEVMS